MPEWLHQTVIAKVGLIGFIVITFLSIMSMMTTLMRILNGPLEFQKVGELSANYHFLNLKDLFVQKICKSQVNAKTLKFDFAVRQKTRSFLPRRLF